MIGPPRWPLPWGGCRMRTPAGRSIPLSLPRRLICDYLHFARQVPSVPVQRTLRLAEVAEARQAADPRPSWAAVFTKAYAFVCAAYPALRRAYLSFPWPQLYEHPVAVASVAVERPFGGEDAVFFGHVSGPQSVGLTDLDLRIRQFKEQPLESCSAFRRQLRAARLPRPVRRALWWL